MRHTYECVHGLCVIENSEGNEILSQVSHYALCSFSVIKIFQRFGWSSALHNPFYDSHNFVGRDLYKPFSIAMILSPQHKVFLCVMAYTLLFLGLVRMHASAFLERSQPICINRHLTIPCHLFALTNSRPRPFLPMITSVVFKRTLFPFLYPPSPNMIPCKESNRTPSAPT